MHIRRNCSSDVDFDVQSQLVRNRFMEMGYNPQQLDKVIQEVSTVTQESCLTEEIKPKDKKHEWGFISNYYDQYREVEMIFRKYWEILKMDKVLGKVLPGVPPFIYRKTSSHIRGLTRSTANGREFEIKEFISCMSIHIVYALECPCRLMYIGRTKRTLGKRISEHIYNISIGYKDHSVSLHFRCKHNGNPAGLKFWGIDKIHPNTSIQFL